MASTTSGRFSSRQNALPAEHYFALIDEDSEERAVNGSFPIRAIEEDVGRLAAKL